MDRRLEHGAARGARAPPKARIKSREDLRELRLDVAHGDALEMQTIAAILAVPGKAVQFLGSAAPFNDDADAPRRTLRGVGHLGGEQEYFPLADRQVGH